MARHEHAHEVLGLLIGIGAGNQNLIDILAVEIAQRPFDQRAFLINELGSGGFERQIAHRFPHPQQIFEIALDLDLGAASTGGAQDHAHAFRHFEFGGGFAQSRPIVRIGDLAADAAAARGIRHQHRVASGERKVRRQRRAFGAALFLDHLHQHHLPALDHFLDFVLAAIARGTIGDFFQCIGAADGFDGLFGPFLVLAVAFGRARLAQRSLAIVGRG